MTSRTVALVGILLVASAGSALDIVFTQSTGWLRDLIEWGPLVLGLMLTFMWLHYDALRVGYRRSPLLNIGIAALGIVFIPVYLYRSRSTGRRGSAFMRFVGFCFLWLGASAVGHYCALAAI